MRISSGVSLKHAVNLLYSRSSHPNQGPSPNGSQSGRQFSLMLWNGNNFGVICARYLSDRYHDTLGTNYALHREVNARVRLIKSSLDCLGRPKCFSYRLLSQVATELADVPLLSQALLYPITDTINFKSGEQTSQNHNLRFFLCSVISSGRRGRKGGQSRENPTTQSIL